MLGTLGRQDGSALLISLMMIFIMTILGLALFDLGVIENRLTSADEADARALEIANAGLERSYRFLTNTITNVTPDTLNSLALSSATYTAIIGNSPFLGGGSYMVQFMLASVANANGVPFGQPCMPVGANCRDLRFARAIGLVSPGCVALPLVTCASGSGPAATYGRVRAIQALVRAESLSPFSYAVTAETQGSTPIRGLIAGSVNFLACSTCNPFGFDSSSLGMRNSYFDLSGDAASMVRIAPLSVVCPAGSSCATQAFSLGATLKVSGPTSAAAVETDADLGEAAHTATYTHSGTGPFAGKGPLDNVFVADGCSSADCSDSFAPTSGVGSAASRVLVNDGNIKKPYPQRPARSFPLLSDSMMIGGVTYTHYACLSTSASPCAGGTQFITAVGGTPGHAGGEGILVSATPAPIVSTTVAQGPCDGACPNLFTLFNDGDFESRAAFVHDFRFTNASGATINGRICWTGTVDNGTVLFPADLRVLLFSSSSAALPAANASLDRLSAGTNCLFGTPFNASSLTTTTAPLLLLVNGNVRFGTNAAGAVTTINYRGAAIIVANGVASIDAILQTRCVTSSLNCAGVTFSGVLAPLSIPAERFPDNHMLAILSTGSTVSHTGMTVGTNKSGLDRVMALLYTEGSFTSAGGSGAGVRNIIIGTVAAREFCFAKGCPGGLSTDETRLFQAGLTVFPDELPPGRNRWRITPLQKFWRECPPTAVTPNYTFTAGMCPY